MSVRLSSIVLRIPSASTHDYNTVLYIRTVEKDSEMKGSK